MDISVYITSYNQKNFLKQAIDSVISQTLKPIEIIIIDDASTDGSDKLIEEYERTYDKWIKPIYNTSNKGISFCRNLAIAKATGKYLTWVDGDDFFFPQKLEKEAALLEDGRYQIAFSNYYLSENDLFSFKSIWANSISDFPQKGTMFEQVLTRKFPRGMLYRSELIERDYIYKVGGYDTDLNIYEDYDLRIRLSKLCNINYTIEPLSIYRLHPAGLSKASKGKHYDAFKYIFEKYKNEVTALKKANREKVELEISKLMESRSTKNTPDKLTLKDRIKMKLINGINRI
ncbi:MAG: glycosyltransferase family 2 protein [Bacteroidota bacterium]